MAQWNRMRLSQLMPPVNSRGKIVKFEWITRKLLETHYGDCHPRKSRHLASELIRYIASKRKFERRTPEFASQIRQKILCLHEYNLEILKTKLKYPISKPFHDLLIRYVEIECESLYGQKRQLDEAMEKKVKPRVLGLVQIILYDALFNDQLSMKQNIFNCKKAVLNLFVHVRADCIHENNLVRSVIVELLEHLGLIEKVNQLKGANIPFHEDTLLGNPVVSDVRDNLVYNIFDDESDFGSDDDTNADYLRLIKREGIQKENKRENTRGTLVERECPAIYTNNMLSEENTRVTISDSEIVVAVSQSNNNNVMETEKKAICSKIDEQFDKEATLPSSIDNTMLDTNNENVTIEIFDDEDDHQLPIQNKQNKLIESVKLKDIKVELDKDSEANSGNADEANGESNSTTLPDETFESINQSVELNKHSNTIVDAPDSIDDDAEATATIIGEAAKEMNSSESVELNKHSNTIVDAPDSSDDDAEATATIIGEAAKEMNSSESVELNKHSNTIVDAPDSIDDNAEATATIIGEAAKEMNSPDGAENSVAEKPKNDEVTDCNNEFIEQAERNVSESELIDAQNAETQNETLAISQDELETDKNSKESEVVSTIINIDKEKLAESATQNTSLGIDENVDASQAKESSEEKKNEANAKLKMSATFIECMEKGEIHVNLDNTENQEINNVANKCGVNTIDEQVESVHSGVNNIDVNETVEICLDKRKNVEDATNVDNKLIDSTELNIETIDISEDTDDYQEQYILDFIKKEVVDSLGPETGNLIEDSFVEPTTIESEKQTNVETNVNTVEDASNIVETESANVADIISQEEVADVSFSEINTTMNVTLSGIDVTEIAVEDKNDPVASAEQEKSSDEEKNADLPSALPTTTPENIKQSSEKCATEETQSSTTEACEAIESVGGIDQCQTDVDKNNKKVGELIDDGINSMAAAAPIQQEILHQETVLDLSRQNPTKPIENEPINECEKSSLLILADTAINVSETNSDLKEKNEKRVVRRKPKPKRGEISNRRITRSFRSIDVSHEYIKLYNLAIEENFSKTPAAQDFMSVNPSSISPAVNNVYQQVEANNSACTENNDYSENVLQIIEPEDEEVDKAIIIYDEDTMDDNLEFKKTQNYENSTLDLSPININEKDKNFEEILQAYFKKNLFKPRVKDTKCGVPEVKQGPSTDHSIEKVLSMPTKSTRKVDFSRVETLANEDKPINTKAQVYDGKKDKSEKKLRSISLNSESDLNNRANSIKRQTRHSVDCEQNMPALPRSKCLNAELLQQNNVVNEEVLSKLIEDLPTQSPKRFKTEREGDFGNASIETKIEKDRVAETPKNDEVTNCNNKKAKGNQKRTVKEKSSKKKGALENVIKKMKEKICEETESNLANCKSELKNQTKVDESLLSKKQGIKNANDNSSRSKSSLKSGQNHSNSNSNESKRPKLSNKEKDSNELPKVEKTENQLRKANEEKKKKISASSPTTSDTKSKPDCQKSKKLPEVTKIKSKTKPISDSKLDETDEKIKNEKIENQMESEEISAKSHPIQSDDSVKHLPKKRKHASDDENKEPKKNKLPGSSELLIPQSDVSLKEVNNLMDPVEESIEQINKNDEVDATEDTTEPCKQPPEVDKEKDQVEREAAKTLLDNDVCPDVASNEFAKMLMQEYNQTSCDVIETANELQENSIYGGDCTLSEISNIQPICTTNKNFSENETDVLNISSVHNVTTTTGAASTTSSCATDVLPNSEIFQSAIPLEEISPTKIHNQLLDFLPLSSDMNPINFLNNEQENGGIGVVPESSNEGKDSTADPNYSSDPLLSGNNLDRSLLEEVFNLDNYSNHNLDEFFSNMCKKEKPDFNEIINDSESIVIDPDQVSKPAEIPNMFKSLDQLIEKPQLKQPASSVDLSIENDPKQQSFESIDTNLEGENDINYSSANETRTNPKVIVQRNESFYPSMIPMAKSSYNHLKNQKFDKPINKEFIGNSTNTHANHLNSPVQQPNTDSINKNNVRNVVREDNNRNTVPTSTGSTSKSRIRVKGDLIDPRQAKRPPQANSEMETLSYTREGTARSSNLQHEKNQRPTTSNRKPPTGSSSHSGFHYRPHPKSDSYYKTDGKSTTTSGSNCQTSGNPSSPRRSNDADLDQHDSTSKITELLQGTPPNLFPTPPRKIEDSTDDVPLPAFFQTMSKWSQIFRKGN